MTLFLIVISLILGFHLKNNPIIAAGLAVLILSVLIKKKRYLVIGLFCFIYLSGLGISFINLHQDKNQYDGLIIDSKENYFILNTGVEKFYLYSKNNDLEIGDYVAIEGKSIELSFNTIESSFDFKQYLNNKGIFYELKIENITKKISNPIRIKHRQQEFLTNFSNNNRSVVSSILFSLNDGDEFVRNTSDLHVARILNLSGIHIYAFIWLFVTLFTFVFKKKKYAELITILFLLTFFVFTFPKFSVLRMLSLFIIRYINRYFLKNKLTYLHTLSISALLFIITDRYIVYQDSFILGYLLPLFIYLLRNSFYKIKGVKQKLLISCASNLFFIPFEISYYHEINIFLLPITLLLSPFSLLISISSLLCFFHIPIYGAVDFLINIFKVIASGINNFSLFIYMPEMNSLFILIYFVTFLLLLYFISIKIKFLSRFFALVYITFLSLYSLPIKNLISTEVSFINVGQGDATLIRTNNHTIFIDTGGLTYMDVARESLIPFLKKKRIYHVDKIIITHNDNDHVGALESLCKNFSVGEIIKEKDAFPFTYHHIVFNNYNVFDYSSMDENYNSLVVGFKLHKTNYLIMGDAPKAIEKKIMDTFTYIPCDILKVGHHGSNTSTSEEFIKYLQPKIGIISCGKNNYYGHPHKEVLSILNKYNIKIRRTDKEGTITYYNYKII